MAARIWPANLIQLFGSGFGVVGWQAAIGGALAAD